VVPPLDGLPLFHLRKSGDFPAVYRTSRKKPHSSFCGMMVSMAMAASRDFALSCFIPFYVIYVRKRKDLLISLSVQSVYDRKGNL
jgi:hypothetical protein